MIDRGGLKILLIRGRKTQKKGIPELELVRRKRGRLDTESFAMCMFVADFMGEKHKIKIYERKKREGRKCWRELWQR